MMTNACSPLDLDALLADTSLLMVGGKGGVGKTTTAAALAWRAARQGWNVLLVSTDPAHSLSDTFACPIGDRPTQLAHGLTALEIDPDKEAEAYLSRVAAQMRRFAGPDQVHQLEKQLRLTRQSPGAQEAALLERIAGIIDDDSQHYDRVIFDTAPTGHTLRLLSLPEIMAAWTDGLLQRNKQSRQLGKVLAHLTPGKDLDSPMQDPDDHGSSDLDGKSREVADTLLKRQRLFRRTRRRLTDADHSAFLFVVTPERLPIQETRRAISILDENRIPIAGLVVNRLLPEQGDSGFFAARRARQQRHRKELADTLGHLSWHEMPLLEDDVVGIDAVGKFAQLLQRD